MSGDLELRTLVTADASELQAVLAQSGREHQAFVQAVTKGNTAQASSAEAVSAATKAQADATKTLTTQAAAVDAASKVVTSAQQAQATALKGVTAEATATAAAQAAVTAKTGAMQAAIASTTPQVKNLGVSAGQTAAAMRQLPAQITDIVTSLQAGQSPLTVAIQQGGQIKDSFGGIGPTFTALTALINPVVAGLGAVAIVAGGLAYAYHAGSAETRAYNQALLLTGNAAGTNAEGLAAMAVQVSKVVGTQSQAAEALAVLAGNGTLAANELVRAGQVAVALDRAFGISVQDTASQLTALSKAPLEASKKANETYHYLTLAVYDHIKALEDQRRTEEAGVVAEKAFLDAMAGRAKDMEDRAGAIERAWRRAKDAIAEVGSAVLSIGRPDPAAAELAALRSRREKDKRPLGGGYFSAAVDPRINESQRRDDARELELQQRQESTAATAAADAQTGAQKAAADAAIKARTENERWADAGLTDIERMSKALQAYRENNKKILEAGGALDPAQVARSEQAIRRQFVGADDNAGDAASLGRVKQRLASVTAAYADAERILEQLRSQGKVSEADYWESKRSFIALDEAAELKALADENELLRAQGTTTAERIRNNAQIAANVAEMARARGKASADTVIANAQEAASLEALTRANVAYVLQLQATAAAQGRQNSRSIEAIGLSDAARERASRRNNINDDYTSQRSKLDGERRDNKVSASDYGARLVELDAYHVEAQRREDDYQAHLMSAQANGSLGMQRALDNYLDHARDVAGQTEQLFTNAFQSMEDAIVKFVATGKLDFKSLAESIIADLIRIQIREQMTKAFSAIASFAGNFFGAGGGGSSAGTIGGFNGSAGTPTIAANVGHGGGVIGSDAFVQRSVPTSMHANAPRFHSGMLASDEFAAILQRGESVLTPAQMRQLAPVGAGGSPVTVNMPVTVINQTGTPAQATTRRTSGGGIEVLLTAMKASIASDISDGSGDIPQAMEGRYGLRASLGG